jgi:hypothetical protein
MNSHATTRGHRRHPTRHVIGTIGRASRVRRHNISCVRSALAVFLVLRIPLLRRGQIGRDVVFQMVLASVLAHIVP